MLELNDSNYFSIESNKEYMSASQFKDFVKCEKEALAKVNGEIVEEPSTAMLFGSYVDAYFSGELEKFKENTPQLFKKDGTLYKDYEKVNDVIAAIKSDPLMMKYLSGKHQVIMTGEINGVTFKIKIDSLLEDAIVDLKIMSSIKELVWVEKDGRNVKTDFVEAYGYDIQGAIYQEIVRQNIGKRLPFILTPVSKEENPDKALIQIDQYWLDKALDFVKANCQRYDLIKQGIIEPVGCGRCPECRKGLVCTEVISYETLFNKVRVEDEE